MSLCTKCKYWVKFETEMLRVGFDGNSRVVGELAEYGSLNNTSLNVPLSR